MKVQGGLSMIEAIMGGGKTLYAVRSGIQHMLAGGFWITNIPLYGYGPEAHRPDALYTVANRVARLSGKKRYAAHMNLRHRYRYCEDMQTALLHADEERRPGAARLRLDWDESLVDLNAREWAGGRGKTADDRNELFEMVPMLRKNGVQAYLLAQHAELIDKNARRVCTYVVRVQNQSESQRWKGIRVGKALPPLFIAYWYRTNKAEKQDRSVVPDYTQRYFRGYYGTLYDTMGLYGASRQAHESGRLIMLGDSTAPELRGDRALRAGEERVPPQLPPDPESSLS